MNKYRKTSMILVKPLGQLFEVWPEICSGRLARVVPIADAASLAHHPRLSITHGSYKYRLAGQGHHPALAIQPRRSRLATMGVALTGTRR